MQGIPWIVSSHLFTRWVFSTLVHNKESEPQRSCVLPKGCPGRTWPWLPIWRWAHTWAVSVGYTLGLFYQQYLQCAENLSQGGIGEPLMRNDQLSLGRIPVASQGIQLILLFFISILAGCFLPLSIPVYTITLISFWKGKGYLPNVKSLLKGLFVLEQTNLKRNELCKVVSKNRCIVKEFQIPKLEGSLRLGGGSACF